MFRLQQLRQMVTAMFSLSAVAAICLLAPTATTYAQHTMMHQQQSPGGQAATLPHDDAVLEHAPARLALEFENEVRLVKLTLRTSEARELLDIGFRYGPNSDTSFTHQLPTLESAPYYIAEWAVVTADERIIQGRFHFAFGPDAQPPSELMPEHTPMRHIMAPDYRVQELQE